MSVLGSRRRSDLSLKLGGWLWVLQIQFFVAQIVAAAAWKTPFSLRLNAISDLGNTACGTYRAIYVCSPMYGLMNVSFVLLGITIAAGSVLIWRASKPRSAAFMACGMMVVAGVGTILVGVFPENVALPFHFTGAGLAFVFNNLALVLLGFGLPLGRLWRRLTTAMGMVALVALISFTLGQSLGLGYGGIERIIASPSIIWMILYGFSLLRNPSSRRASKTA